MSQTPVYTIRSLGRIRAGGSTAPVSGTISAFIKFDGPESEHCVYNELVAVRLAQTLHVPVAAGVLTVAGLGTAFASLELGLVGLPLPDVAESRLEEVARQYPDSVAAMVAFDILIGNDDRGSGFKASRYAQHMPLFQAFDHSHALLGIESSLDKSLRRLRHGDLIVTSHPFYGLVDGVALWKWVARITEMPDGLVRECCEAGRPIGRVTPKWQSMLASALTIRKKALNVLIKTHEQHIIGNA